MTKTSHEEAVLAATKIFRESGYSGFSLSKLATALGIRKASLYSRFSGKEEIALQSIFLSAQEVLQFEPKEGNWHEQYSQFVEFLSKLLLEKQRCIGMQMGYGDAPYEVKIAIEGFFEVLISMPEKILLQNFEPKRAREIAEDCIGALEGATIWLAVRGDAAPMRRVVKQQVALALMENQAQLTQL